ncbi:Family of serine hydrolases 3 [Candida viswanathii]|uniref:Family of serine hydrolases 3 n=1 Tax=Candida viswanathii TaxID=5486 RepID=A0A367YGM4_9ASCO|nr:Family of serine hydrolases 3 [Candida viswanathii]
MTSKKSPTYKGKILFLHGYTQSASLFYAKTSALRKKLIKLGYKCVYLNGPYVLTPADLPSGDSLSKFGSSTNTDEVIYRAWWVKKEATNDNIDVDDSIQTIKNYIDSGEVIPDEDLKTEPETEEERKLPVVGIIGFSQGAAFGGLIAHKFHELFETEPLKFVVLYSGFKLDTSKKAGNHKYDSHYPQTEEEVVNSHFKYLHVYGELDTVVEEARAYTLYDLTKSSSELLKHPGGHFVPNSKLYVDQVTNWIQANLEKKEEEEPETKVEEKKDDIDSLLEMMDNFGKA